MTYNQQQRPDDPGGNDRHVYVCGLPGSGNRLFRDYCLSLGWSSSLWHGDEKPGYAGPLVKYPRADIRCIIPVRHPVARERSYVPNPKRPYPEECRSRVMRWASTVPTYMASYEAACSDPEGVFRDLAAWLDVPYKPCPFEVYDGTGARLQEV